MIETKPTTKIEFHPITLREKALYESYLSLEDERGCEFSFANLYLWGRQNFAVLHDHVVLFSQFDRRSIYPYPIGNGDKKEVLDCIIEDARARGIPCRITGLSSEAIKTLETLYPEKFRFPFMLLDRRRLISVCILSQQCSPSFSTLSGKCIDCTLLQCANA